MNGFAQGSLKLIGLCLAPLGGSGSSPLESEVELIDDWEEVLHLSGDRYVTPLVFARLREAGLDDRIPEPIRSKFEKIYLNNAALNSLRLKQAGAVNRRAREQGAAMLFLKGASMVMGGDYPDPGQRMFSDIDVLADHRYYQEVRRAFLEADGWRELAIMRMAEWETSPWVNRWGTSIDVHWRLKPFNDVPGKLVRERLWANSREVSYRGQSALIPSPECRYIQSAVHSTAHHPFDSAIFFITVSDLCHAAGRAKEGLDWKRIADDLERERMSGHVAVATQTALELTGFEPLAHGLSVIHAHNPGLSEITVPFSRAFLALLCKPWLFNSHIESQVLAKKSWLKGARFFSSHVRRKASGLFRKEYTSPEVHQILEGISASPLYRKKVWDPDYLRFLYQLYRFYRRLGYTSLE